MGASRLRWRHVLPVQFICPHCLQVPSARLCSCSAGSHPTLAAEPKPLCGLRMHAQQPGLFCISSDSWTQVAHLAGTAQVNVLSAQGTSLDSVHLDQHRVHKTHSLLFQAASAEALKLRKKLKRWLHVESIGTGAISTGKLCTQGLSCDSHSSRQSQALAGRQGCTSGRGGAGGRALCSGHVPGQCAC